MHPILVDLGRIKVYSWGFMLALAVLIAVMGIARMFRQEGYNQDHALDIVVILVLTGLLGSRVAYITLFQWQEFLINPWIIFFGWNSGGFSGLVWYGGFTASVLTGWMYIKAKGYNFGKIADIFAPWLALSYSLVRIGCFLNGCCYGKASDAACTVVFPYVDGLSRYPTQLYSAGINLLLFVLLLWYYPRRRFTGEVFVLYLLGYSVYRFVIEFWRENWAFVGPFSVSQFYSLIIFGLAVIAYIGLRKRANSRKS